MRYKEEKTEGILDCAECCFALDCTNPCRLPKGMHYVEVDE